MNESCVRELSLREYIYQLGQKELCHDYEAETKRIIALFDEHEKMRDERYFRQIQTLEEELATARTIIRVLAQRIQLREE